MKQKQLLHQPLFFIGTVMLAAGMPVSLFLTSLSQFVLAGSFFIEGNIKEKFKRFLSNKTALIITGIWVLHLLSFWNSENLHQALNDLRIKLPILVLTLIMAASKPLSKDQFNWVKGVFVFSVLCGTVVSMAVFTGIIPKKIYDIREIFILGVSNIRFALFTCIAVCFLLHSLWTERKSLSAWKISFFILLILWLMAFLVISESATGVIILGLILFGYLIAVFWKMDSIVFKIIIAFFLFAIPIATYFLFQNIYINYLQPKHEHIDRSAKTLNGNHYIFDEDAQTENGYLIYSYICDEELRTAWNQRSQMNYDSLDNNKNGIKYTLIRFLTSKGLRKDSAAVYQLSIDEIKSIENGIANIHYQNMGNIKARLIKLMYEIDFYRKGFGVNGSSLGMRFEFWKNGWSIFKENIFTGVGIGDLQKEFNDAYERNNTTLKMENRLRAHNQYLTIAISTGIFGFFYFLFALFYPLFNYRNRNFYYLTFFFILLLSMTTEDTLETQAGATFFSFFTALFLFALPDEVLQQKNISEQN